MKTIFLTTMLVLSFSLSVLTGAEWLPSIQVAPTGQNPVVKLDPAGHAVAVWLSPDKTSIISGVLPRGDRAWQEIPVYTIPFPGTVATLNLGLDARGDAVAMWLETTIEGNFIYASTLAFGSKTWSPLVLIRTVSPAEVSSNPSMGVDANGNAIIVWQALVSTGASSIETSVLPYGSMTTPTPQTLFSFNAYNVQPNVSVNASGQAIAVWASETEVPPTAGFGSVNAAFYNGSSWEPTFELFPPLSTFSQTPMAAIDPNGNGVAIWYTSPAVRTADITGASYMSTGWSSAMPITTVISSNTNSNPFLQLGVDAAGNALATFQNGISPATTLESAALPFGAAGWNAVQTVTGSAGAGPDSLTVSPSGLSTVTWVNASNDVLASMSPSVTGTPWGAPVFLSTTATAGQMTAVASDALGEFITVWQETNGSLRSSFYDPFPLPPSPTVVTGARGFNQFLLQKELFVTITIFPYTTPNQVVAYEIFSDAGLTNLVAEIPVSSNPVNAVIHHVRRGPQTFYVVAVDSLGFFSTPVIITI